MKKWGIDDFEIDPVVKIEETKERWKKSLQELEDVKYIENLIHADFINSIKSYKTAWDYRLPTIKAALKELDIKDRRKRRPNIECLNSWIKKEFFPELDVKINVNKIISYGYEGYHWQMNFDINGEEYSISVPDKRMINMDNADHAYYGKFAFLHRTGKSSISVECIEYEEEKLAKYIEKYFKGGNKE